MWPWGRAAQGGKDVKSNDSTSNIMGAELGHHSKSMGISAGPEAWAQGVGAGTPL